MVCSMGLLQKMCVCLLCAIYNMEPICQVRPMKKTSQARDVLTLFATYGFRKASMGDIAHAAGLSRQSIYNQHGSKEAVLDWALTDFLGEISDKAVACLSKGSMALDALGNAFQAWIGDNVDMMRGTPHGGELLETAIASAANSYRDYEAEFSSAVERFLVARGMASEAIASDVNFVLQTAAKGLLLKSKTAEDFKKGMGRVIRAVIQK